MLYGWIRYSKSFPNCDAPNTTSTRSMHIADKLQSSNVRIYITIYSKLWHLSTHGIIL